jgi:stage V sporulation protein G
MPRKQAAPPTQQQEQTQDQVIQTVAPTQEMPPIHLDVRVRPVAQKGNLLGYASINLGGAFAVDGIKVVNGKNGLFTSMPSYQDGKGQYRDICFPITPEFRKQLNEAVVTEYQQTLEQMQTASMQQGQTRETPEMTAPIMA